MKLDAAADGGRNVVKLEKRRPMTCRRRFDCRRRRAAAVAQTAATRESFFLKKNWNLGVRFERVNRSADTPTLRHFIDPTTQPPLHFRDFAAKRFVQSPRT